MMKTHDYIQQAMYQNDMEMLTEEQRAVAKLLAKGQPVTVPTETLFNYFHNVDFTDYLFGILSEEPFAEYLSDSRLRFPNDPLWRQLFIDDFAESVRSYLYGHLSDEEIDPEVSVSSSRIEVVD